MTSELSVIELKSLLHQAHAALRKVDASDTTIPQLTPTLDAVSDAIQAMEEALPFLRSDPSWPDPSKCGQEIANTEPKAKQAIEDAVAAIWKDMTDRRGIKWELQSCDPDIQEEIRNVWRKQINKVLEISLTPSE